MDVLIIPLAFISARKTDNFLYRDFLTSTFLPGGQTTNKWFLKKLDDSIGRSLGFIVVLHAFKKQYSNN